MRVDYNEFLRIMTCILIILLIIQGLDYLTGFGVNNHIFIIFCIVFAFTIGTIYHNILMERKAEEMECVDEDCDDSCSCDMVVGSVDDESSVDGESDDDDE